MLTENTISQEIIDHYLSNSKKLEFPKSLLPNLEKIATEYFKLKKSFEELLDNDNLFLFEKEKNSLVQSIGFNDNIIFASVWGANHVVINSSLNNSDSLSYPNVSSLAMRASFSLPLSYSENVDMFFDMPYENMEINTKKKKSKIKSYSELENCSIDIVKETAKLIDFVKTDFQTIYDNNLIQANNKIKKIYYLGEILLQLLKENIDVENFLTYNHSYLYNEINDNIDLISDFLSLNSDIDISDQVNKYKKIELIKPQYPKIKK